MSLGARLAALRDRHRNLDRRLQEMQSRPGPDTLGEALIKKQKLALKEEIARLQQQMLREQDMPAGIVAGAGEGAPPPLYAA